MYPMLHVCMGPMICTKSMYVTTCMRMQAWRDVMLCTYNCMCALKSSDTLVNRYEFKCIRL